MHGRGREKAIPVGLIQKKNYFDTTSGNWFVHACVCVEVLPPEIPVSDVTIYRASVKNFEM